MTTVAFDVDGTLIHQIGDQEDSPRYEVIQLYKILESAGCEMFIWSGGGLGYAERWAQKLGLNGTIIIKGSLVPDIAVDDEEVTLGKVNLRI